MCVGGLRIEPSHSPPLLPQATGEGTIRSLTGIEVTYYSAPART